MANSEMKDNPVFVFDLDGVITDVHNSSVNKVAVDHVHGLLEKGSYVAVNTGRSFGWVRSNLLNPLEEIGGTERFDHLFIVCEKGGESIKWNGTTFQPQPSRFALSEGTKKISRQIYEENKPQLGTMFWDDTKLTMVTIEKRPEANLEQFRSEQKFLASRLQEVFPGVEVKVDPTTIATDVESLYAGKHAGAELIHEWTVAYVGNAHVKFISFGDSRSDYEMARYFAQQGNSSTFVFVGSKTETFDEEVGVELIRTDAEYAAGTNEYFERIAQTR